MNKIVIHVDSLRRDGAERVSVNLAKYLTAHGVCCTLVTERVADFEYDCPEGVERISLGVHGNKYAHYLGNVVKFRRILKDLKPDMLLVMDTPGCLLAIPAARGLGLKSVVSERNDPTHFPGKAIVARVARYLMSKADGFVFQTEDAADFYNNFAKDRCAVIPNPLFVADLPTPIEGEREHEIVAAGRLTSQKNQELLINAFSCVHPDFPGWTLRIYGEGELRETLEKQIEKLKLGGNVALPGNKPDLLDRIKTASVFVMPSDFEGMPNALLEAMSLGLACISTDCPIGGPRAVIESGQNGILTKVGDIGELEAALRMLLEDEEKRRKLAQSAVGIRKRLDSDVICRQWQNYLESL